MLHCWGGELLLTPFNAALRARTVAGLLQALKVTTQQGGTHGPAARNASARLAPHAALNAVKSTALQL